MGRVDLEYLMVKGKKLLKLVVIMRYKCTGAGIFCGTSTFISLVLNVLFEICVLYGGLSDK